MHPERKRILSKLEDINQDLENLFSKLEDYSDDKLNKAPKEGKWSVSQIMNHLILAETLSLKYCHKKLSFNPELKKSGWKTRIGYLRLYLILSVPIKVKAPQNVSGDALPDFEEIQKTISKWRAQRKLLEKFIQEVDEKYIDREVYKHPFGMRLSLYYMLSFYYTHYLRHKKQILRIL